MPLVQEQMLAHPLQIQIKNVKVLIKEPLVDPSELLTNEIRLVRKAAPHGLLFRTGTWADIN